MTDEETQGAHLAQVGLESTVKGLELCPAGEVRPEAFKQMFTTFCRAHCPSSQGCAMEIMTASGRTEWNGEW